VMLSDVANGVGGFKIAGTAQWQVGGWVSVADDINGDGLAEVIVGAGNVNRTIVVYGKADTTQVLAPEIEAGDGTRGYTILGGGPNSGGGSAGFMVAGIGDLNADGRGDILVGAQQGSFVVYGQAVRPVVSLSDVSAGAGGFRIDSVAASFFPVGRAA